MARCESTKISDPMLDPDLAPEVRAMIGVLALFTRIQTCIEEIAPDDQLTENQRHLLVKLDQPRRMGDLAQVMNTLPSSLTALADTLETRGLVERVRAPEDRRAWLLQLTDEGAAIRSEMLTMAGNLFREVTGLNPNEMTTFAELTDKIRGHMLRSTPEHEGLPR